jgi:hypothetical protein
VSTQTNVGLSTNQIDLVDIGIQVVDGASPWNVSEVSGLLNAHNASIGQSLPVDILPVAPYLDLPQSTCDAIAAWLPVTYQAKYGLYFWNVNDPQYSKIVSSPSVLSFTFAKDQSNTKNLTINVPFALLNLTLDTPLISTPTQYFPCNAQSRGYYSLGRAFLQAAFLGTNWETPSGSGTWWLAQAPGPNIVAQPNIQSIQPSDTTLRPSQNDWKTSWQGSWTPLASPASPSAAASSTSTASPAAASSGLSVGARAGIGVGVAAAAIIAFVAGVYFFRHRQSQRHASTAAASPGAVFSENKSTPKYEVAGYYPVEMDGQGEQRDLPASQSIGTNQEGVHELP